MLGLRLIPTIRSSVVDRGGSDWIFFFANENIQQFFYFLFLKVRECKIKIKRTFLFSFHSFFLFNGQMFST